MSDVYFFGCANDDKGHYLFDEDMRSTRPPENVPFKRWGYDGGFWAAEGGQHQGKATVVVRSGWTYMGFWDRSVDERGNSNAGLLARGEYTFEEMVEFFKKHFPKIWARFKFTVYLDKCSTCGEPYSEEPFSRGALFSNSFHNCRECEWIGGRVRPGNECDRHKGVMQ